MIQILTIEALVLHLLQRIPTRQKILPTAIIVKRNELRLRFKRTKIASAKKVIGKNLLQIRKVTVEKRRSKKVVKTVIEMIATHQIQINMLEYLCILLTPNQAKKKGFRINCKYIPSVHLAMIKLLLYILSLFVR